MSDRLLDVTPVTIPHQQEFDGCVFPLVLQCNENRATLDATVDWVRNRRDGLLELANKHGAVLFRGFPLATPQDLDAFIAAFDLPNFPYYESLSNAVRVNWTERVFSANEAPPEITIHFHHEMAQTPIFPAKLFFFCQQPAEEGGATPICRSDVLFERLTAKCPRFARNCEEKGLIYSNVMPAENDPKSGMGRSWQSTLRATTREEAEARLKALGYSWEWQPDGCLRATTPVLPAVREVRVLRGSPDPASVVRGSPDPVSVVRGSPDPAQSGAVSGNPRTTEVRKTFFNQLIAAFAGWKDARNDPSKAIRFGDGAPLDRDSVQVAIDLAEELTFDVPWQRGDAVLVDNFLVMHGRRTFRGTRKVLASLAEPHTRGATSW